MSDARPKVSVVIPTFDRAALVLEAAVSALAQSYTNLEVLIVDDGSTDDTAARVADLRDPRVRYLRRRHGGVSAARNTGIAAATGSIVAFLDADDLWKPDKVAGDVDVFVRYPDVGVVFTDLEKHDAGVFTYSFMRTTATFAHLGPDRLATPLVLSPREMTLHLLQEVPVKTPALSVRRDALAAAGPFDERWTSAEDWEMLLRLARTQRFAYIDRALAIIRVMPDALHRRDQERAEHAMLRLLSTVAATAADGELRRAARRGVTVRARHLGWHYVDTGRRLAAAAVHLRCFRATRNAEHLARAALSLISPSAAACLVLSGGVA
jgi:hypothetical protein